MTLPKALLGLCAIAFLGATCDVRAQSAASGTIPDLAGKVMTVQGAVDPSVLGSTLMHEHIFIDFEIPWNDTRRWQLTGRTRPKSATDVALYNAPLTIDILGEVFMGKPNRDNWLLDDEPTAIAEVGYFKQAGGGTIVDATSIGIKRNPEGLRRVSEATGVNIVMGSSWYTRGWYPESVADRSVESLTNEIVHDITVGVNGTGIRSGIIGEVGTSGNPDEPTENKIIRASGRASRLTGAPIMVHSLGFFRQHHKILDILASEGADLHRVVLGHSAYLAHDIDYVVSVLKRGATIEFDFLGKPPTLTRRRPMDYDAAQAIVALVKAGYINQITLSHDICTKTSLRAYGGTGYAYIQTTFLPYLREHGLTDAQIHTISVENPRRLLTFVAPKPPLERTGAMPSVSQHALAANVH